MLRGVKKKLKEIILIILLCIIMSDKVLAENEKIILKYTSPSNMLNLNNKIQNNYYAKESGINHIILEEIFKDTNATLNYIGYNNYKESIEKAKLYLSKQNIIDMIIGITFDENNIEYLNYIPLPIYKDYIVLVINKNNIIDKSKITKDIEETIKGLNETTIAIEIEGIKLGKLSEYPHEEEEDINKAMERVYKEKAYIITPWEFMGSYIKNNQGNPELKKVQILKYPKNEIAYFIAINKNRKENKIMKSGESYNLYEYMSKRINEMQNNGELEKIRKELEIK